MFRVRKSILDSLKFQRQRFVRHFSTPTLPEFADVVIIGEGGERRSVKGEKLLTENAV